MINNLGYGVFLTPQNRPNKDPIQTETKRITSANGGLVYDINKNVLPQSIDKRFTVMPINDKLELIYKLDISYLFLGYYFRHYGHFIFETLPMLSYCLKSEYNNYKKIFLPYFLHGNNVEKNIKQDKNLNLFRSFLSLTSIPTNSIEFHTEYKILYSNIYVPDKICKGNKKDVDVEPYRIVIDDIKNNIGLVNNKSSTLNKFFLSRTIDNNRINSYIATAIMHQCKNMGFIIIDMPSLSIKDQITLMHNADIICGFSGSQIHNSMFMKSSGRCITLCDIRDFKYPRKYSVNQELCDRVSGCESHFIDFVCKENIDTTLKEHEINEKLTKDQQKHAIKHYIESIESLL
jgi:hypothetical protein